MGYSQRAPRFQSSFASSGPPAAGAPTFGGPAPFAQGAIGRAIGGALGAPSPSVKPGHGTQPLPSFLDAPSEQPVSTGRAENFQRSLNLERANTANSAAVFAQNAPLPIAPNPDLAQYGRGGRPPDGMPATTYSGAFGNGPNAQGQAEAARAAYVARQQTTANAQNFGAGQNYFENQQLRQDWNARENQDADTRAEAPPDAKEEALRAKALRDQTYAEQYLPAVVENKKAGTDATAVKTGILKDAAPANLDKTRSQTDVNQARAAAIPKGTDTAANREARIAANPPNAYRGVDANAKDAVTMARKEHDRTAHDLQAIEAQLNALPPVNSPMIAKQRNDLQAQYAAKQREFGTAKQAYEAAVAGAAQQRNAAAKPLPLGGPTATPPGIQKAQRELDLLKTEVNRGGDNPQYQQQKAQRIKELEAQLLAGEMSDPSPMEVPDAKSPGRDVLRPATQPNAGTPLSARDAQSILQEAGGDKAKARQIAQSRGYSF